MVLQTQVKINSVDVTSYVINYEDEATFGDVIAQVDINVVTNISNVLILATGQSVEIWRGWSTPTDLKVFSGSIESYNPDSGKIKIVAKDKLWNLVRGEVTHNYDSTVDPTAGKISAIFQDLVTTFGGLNADATTIQDSGTAITLDQFVCNHADVFERCQALADALEWQFYYRADTDKVYFEPKGFTVNTTILTVGDNVYNIPKWSYDNTDMVNDLTVVGAYQEIETTESGRIDTTSGYTTSSIALTFTPISVKIYMDASNPPTTLKVGGLPDSTSVFDYYVDKLNKKILPAPGTSFTSADYAEIRYSHAVPVPVHQISQVSIDAYGTFTNTVTYEDLRNVDDAEQRGSNYLLKYSQPFIYATLKVENNSTNNLKAGDIITIVDGISIPNVNESLIINKLRIRYPADFDEIDVGDKIWRLAEWQADVQEQIKRLNEKQFDNQDILTELRTFDYTPTPITIAPRYDKLQIGTPTGNGQFILGDATFGILGTSLLGDAGIVITDYFIQQYQDIYSEAFFDTDFEDAPNTTATWDTTNKQLTFN